MSSSQVQGQSRRLAFENWWPVPDKVAALPLGAGKYSIEERPSGVGIDLDKSRTCISKMEIVTHKDT